MISRESNDKRELKLRTLVYLTFVITALALSIQEAFAQEGDDVDAVHVEPRLTLIGRNQPRADEPAQTEGQPSAQVDQAPRPKRSSAGTITVPAGTTLPLVLARPLSLKHTKAGDTAYLETTFPISVGGQMAIPPGTFLQGIIERVTQRDKFRCVLAFDLRSVQMIFPTGYTVNVPGFLAADPTVAQSTPPIVPGRGNIPVLAATGGPTLPPLPPLPGSGTRNVIIGLGAAATVGIIVTSIFLVHRTDVLVEPGVSMQAVLTAPLELDQDRVMVAVQQYGAQRAGTSPSIPYAPALGSASASASSSTGTCWTAANPGTPDVVIPGTPPTVIPGTPPTTIPGDPPTVIPGTPDTVIPGTPPTVIPGTPAQDPQPYPCPK